MSQKPSPSDTTGNIEAPSSSGSTESAIQQESTIITVHGATEIPDAETIEGAKGSSTKSLASKSEDITLTTKAVDITKSEEIVKVEAIRPPLPPKKTYSKIFDALSKKTPVETEKIAAETSNADDDKLDTNIISTSSGTASEKELKVYQVKNALLIKLLMKGIDSDKDADVSKRLLEANILKKKPATPQSSKKTASTAEMLKLSLKNMESNSPMSDKAYSPPTHEMKSFELEPIDSPKDATKSMEATKQESPKDSKKVESPKKKKTNSPKKTGSPKTRSNPDTPTQMDSPKVIISNPSGSIVDVIEPEADATKSPKKKPLFKSDKHKALFPKDDSGLSGSGSDCETSEQRVFASPFAWFAPFTNNKAINDDDLLHITDLIHGTWSKVYRWPPASDRLPRPREVTFERPSKLESVLYTCRCKNDYMDFYAPIKMLPEDDHDRVFSCQLVNDERDVMEALGNDRCVCRVIPLVNKIVFLPINEHYVLMYRLESDTTYNELHPNTAYLLYKGIPSKQELEHHIGHLQISKRPGSLTFIDKYDE